MDMETLQAMRELLAEQEQRLEVKMGQIVDEKLEAALKPIKADLEEIKEDIQEVKGSIASVVDWIDEAEHAVEIRFPVRKKSS